MVSQTLDNTLGAILVGAVISCVIYGISSLHVYIYYHKFETDTRLLSLVVAVIWVLDTLHLCLIVTSVYHYAVQSFGEVAGLFKIHWSAKATVLINVFVVLLVQSVYVYRVWRLTGYHKGVLGYIVVLSLLGGLVVGIVLVQQTFKATSFLELQTLSFSATTKSTFVISTTIDFVIAVAMCYYLSKSKGAGLARSRLNSRISVIMARLCVFSPALQRPLNLYPAIYSLFWAVH
ncbi:hypothetical protein B0H10DRAFT_2021112 [Mycena sp. CBHHK59/15]|nr:hypothetical protein B0H10DRAFT_2021112 [Mycena sp. CBHHK59/15]